MKRSTRKEQKCGILTITCTDSRAVELRDRNCYTAYKK